ncbi:hypothetical protein AZI87_17000 [Bdellovibrio bacteriovorus]|uniref:HTH cro/C1-type domain-containing protein n=1 Tax=Bdellovibrio bacteriovorus TaxID=959 RepID=A0A161PP42_BDEBC|nr:TIGR02147 family protein [Bdellovibrio bacteriovorus]KYG62958.1 hypothetical protein AZI87_17000 [Bdellovibrio bacteriovorus]
MSKWKQLLQYDIKEYLVQVIENKKKKNPRFSQRAFATKIGLSASTLNETLRGKRKLSKKTIAKLKIALEGDADFLEILESPLPPFSNFCVATNELTSIASSWYHYVILELTSTEDFNDNAEWISARIGISPEEAQKALNDLLNINELKRNQFNKIISTNKNCIKVADETSRTIMIKTATEYLQKAQDSFTKRPPHERFWSNMVIACSSEDMDYIQTKAVEFVQECHEYLSRLNVPKDEVYVLNIGFTPMTKKVETVSLSD